MPLKTMLCSSRMAMEKLATEKTAVERPVAGTSPAGAMTVENEAARAQIQRILQSKTFRTSEVQRNLLNYLAGHSLAGTAHTLKEYTVGMDAFGKPPSYDPRQESVVRMHSGRVRQKLADYYRTEGAADPIFVDLPKGGFLLTFESRPAAAEPLPVPPPAAAGAEDRWRWRSLRLLTIALILATGSAAYLGERLWKATREQPQNSQSDAAASTPELKQLWSPVFSSSRPLIVCLATPLLVRIPGVGFFRDFSLNDWSDAGKSKSAASLKAALPGTSAPAAPGVPFYGFTGMGEATGAFLLGQFLASRKQYVLLTSSDQVSMPDVSMDNVIFLGPPSVNRELQALSAGQAFVLDPYGIRNPNPRPGEPAFIPDRLGYDEETHALISVLPGIQGKGEIVYLSGNQASSVTAAVQALTEPTLARKLVAELKSGTGSMPRYYQVVLKVRSMDSMPVDVAFMFHRELPRK